MLSAVTIDKEVQTLGERAMMLRYSTLHVLLNLLHLTECLVKSLAFEFRNREISVIRCLEAKASPLHGQCKGEPDGRRVEHGGDDFVHDVPSVAGAYRREWLVVVAERIHVAEPRRREEQGEHVGEGHGHEHGVGGSAHVPLGQHHHDQCVGDDGDHPQGGHHITVHRLCVADV